MRYGMPLLGNRVSPRCTIADRLLLVTINRSRVSTQQVLELDTHSWHDLIRVLLETQVDTVVCGGISAASKDELLSRSINVVDNVVGTSDEVLAALVKGLLRPGLGLHAEEPVSAGSEREPANRVAAPHPDAAFSPDCLACHDRVCLRGERCDQITARLPGAHDDTERRMIDAAVDIACERDRTLCRLSELIYFCLDMQYQRIGLAFCVDLWEPAEILTGVLRRFFDVLPVCCKTGGAGVVHPEMGADSVRDPIAGDSISCNPLAQADVLNRAGTDLNVVVGLCMGADCVFTRASRAPVTTLFVKDRSLANNPIGAVYSDYYLKEATRSAAT
jgi:uncharacterized metal-binding protein/predicted Fe-Mo cluster-binding NifX family protein